MQNDPVEELRKLLIPQLRVDFAVLAMLASERAESERRRREQANAKFKDSLRHYTVPADNVRVARSQAAVAVELHERLQERERFFQKHGINLGPVATIQVRRSRTPYEEERARLAMEWYNAKDTYPANAIAARRYFLHVKGSSGLLHLYLNGGGMGPSLFNILGFIGGPGAVQAQTGRWYPKIESR